MDKTLMSDPMLVNMPVLTLTHLKCVLFHALSGINSYILVIFLRQFGFTSPLDSLADMIDTAYADVLGCISYRKMSPPIIGTSP